MDWVRGCALSIMLMAAWPLWAAERVALVIGNNDYVTIKGLNNAVKDARDVAALLSQPELGFTVIEGFNLTEAQMLEKLEVFGEALKAPGKIGMLFYAGHGAQVPVGTGDAASAENLLMPIDVSTDSRSALLSSSLRLTDVLNTMAGAGRDVNVVVLDACRDNPASGTRGGRGLAPVTSDGGFLVQYATAAGRTTEDGPPGGNGVYTQELLRFLGEPGKSLGDVFTLVAGAVKAKTKQEPWMSSNLGELVYLAGAGAGAGSVQRQDPVALPDPVVAAAEILSFDATPRFISRGRRVQLTWSVQNADKCELAVPGDEPREISAGSNSEQVSVRRSGDIVLTCSGGGRSISETQSVKIRSNRSADDDVSVSKDARYCCDPNNRIKVCTVQGVQLNSACWCPGVVGAGYGCN